MDKKEKKWWAAVIQDKMEHTEMSPETKIAIDNITKSMEDLKKELKEFRKEVKTALENLDDKFASKLVERIVFVGCGVALLFVLNNVLNLT